MIEVEEFIAAYQKKDPNLAEEHLRRLFQEADTSEDGMLQFDEFVKGGSWTCNTYSQSIEMRYANPHAHSLHFQCHKCQI